MSESVDIRISGLEEVEYALKEAAPRAAIRAVRKGLREMGKVIARHAKENIRERIHRRTGLLEDKGVGVRPKPRARKARTEMVFEVYLRRHTFYGKFLEFGTSKIAARPWLRPAAEHGKEEAVRVFRDFTLAKLLVELLKATL